MGALVAAHRPHGHSPTETGPPLPNHCLQHERLPCCHTREVLGAHTRVQEGTEGTASAGTATTRPAA
eukprot:1227926-Prorocentrum_lima.AAC.1